MAQHIVVTEYNPLWSKIFDIEAVKIKKFLERTHQIYIFSEDNAGDIERHLAVRDYLRMQKTVCDENPEIRIGRNTKDFGNGFYHCRACDSAWMCVDET